MSIASFILALVTMQRLGELVLARHNTSRLLASGAVEVGASHYPLLVVDACRVARPRCGSTAMTSGSNRWRCCGFIALQGLRGGCWRRWGRAGPRASLCCRARRWFVDGPYRYIAHPNYVVVAAEIALLPLALHLPLLALVFSLLNAAVLAIRIRTEAHALDMIGGRAA